MTDALLLARAQFGANITFHIIFPSITIALSWFLLFFRIMADKSRCSQQAWHKLYLFWLKIFALCFALGIVSGVTMSFQFGTNWPKFMKTVGDVAGPLLAYEVLTAFFLEATFLGIMLFGRNRVKPMLYKLAIFMVAFGTTLSAFWILSLISWMHTPAGHVIVNGTVKAANWLEIVWNPSMPVRLLHKILASGLTCSFFIAGISAYRFLRNDKSPDVPLGLKTSLYAALFLATMQIFAGDLHGLNTFKHQPRKVAAMEGIWETEKGAGLRLFAIPNKEKQMNDFEITIPKASSIILTHSLDGEVKGLKSFDDAPPVTPVFFAFRIMVGLGFLMLFVAAIGAFQMYRYKTINSLTAQILKYMTFSGLLATISGWYTTEIGRQPWLVEGILKTKDAASNVASQMIMSTFLGYISVYIFLLVAFISTIFYMARNSNEEKT